MKGKEIPYIVMGRDFSNTSLVDHNNNFYKSIDTYEAIKISKENGLDLVCFKEADTNNLPFCKIINFGKWKYHQEKEKKKQNKDQKKDIKELRFSMEISEHDIEHKIRQAKEFFQNGNDVVFTMKLRGRQKLREKDALEKMISIKDMCADCCDEVSRKQDGGNIIIRLKSKK